MVQAELPITAHAETLVTAIGENPVVVVIGETGSGKTTQLSQVAIGGLCPPRANQSQTGLNTCYAVAVQGRLCRQGGNSSDTATPSGEHAHLASSFAPA